MATQGANRKEAARIVGELLSKHAPRGEDLFEDTTRKTGQPPAAMNRQLCDPCVIL